MRLTKIHWSNVKGSSGEEELLPVTLYCGENYSGKTTRSNVITLGLLGFLPSRGKLARATFGLSSGSEMRVGLDFDDGTTIRRRWWLVGDTVKTEYKGPEAFEKDDRFGVMLDPALYFSKGPTERRDYVAANCPMPPNVDHTPLGIAARVERVIGKTVAWKVSVPVPPIQTYVEQNLAWFSDQAKAAKETGDRMEETIRGLSGIRAADAPSTPLTVLDDRQKTLRVERDAAQTIRGGLASRVMTADRDRNRRESLQREIANRPAGEAKLAVAEKEVRRLTDDIEMGQWPEAGRIEELRKIEADARTTEANRSTEFRLARGAQDSDRRSLSEIEGRDSCPFCGAKGEGWKALRRAELLGKIASGEDNLSFLTAELSKAQDGRKSAEREIGSILEENKRLESLRGLKTSAERLFESIKAALAVIAAKEAELAAMPPAPEADETALREAEDKIAKLDDLLREVETLRSAALRRSGDLQRLAQAEADRDKARADEETLRAALKELKAVQAELVASAFVPLLESANALFPGLLKSPLAYSIEKAEVGRWRRGIWVSHEVFTGTEQLLAYAAIQMALVAKAPCRILVLDEMFRTHRKLFAQVFLACWTAVQGGKIDNFVGLAPADRSDLTAFEAFSETKILEVPPSEE